MNLNNLINFNPSESDGYAYRIFSLQRFLEVLERKSLTLVSPAKWEDPFENFIHHHFRKKYSDPTRVMRWYGGNLVGQCWTLHRETDAMWRIYSSDKNGVKVKVKIKSLFEALWNSHYDPMTATTCCYLGKVEYQSKRMISEVLKKPGLEKTLSGDDTAYKRALYLLLKRNEFSHEKEIRLIYEYISLEQLRNGAYYDVPIDPSGLFESIVLDPRMSETEFRMYRSGIEALGYTGNITKSQLYSLDI